MMVLLVILGILVLISALPLEILAEYDQNGGSLIAYLGLIQWTLYPRADKVSKAAKKTSKDKSQNKKTETGLGGDLSFFRELLSLGLDVLACLRNRLLLKELTVYLTIGALYRDPAQWGILYGGAWAMIGNLIPGLERIFLINNRDIQVFLKEDTDQVSIYARGRFRLLLGEVLYMVLYYGLRGLKIYTKRKGSNEHGTSHQ